LGSLCRSGELSAGDATTIRDLCDEAGFPSCGITVAVTSDDDAATNAFDQWTEDASTEDSIISSTYTVVGLGFHACGDETYATAIYGTDNGEYRTNNALIMIDTLY
jgi:hypothetical protein